LHHNDDDSAVLTQHSGTPGIFLLSETFKINRRQTTTQRDMWRYTKFTFLGLVDNHNGAVGILLMVKTFVENDLIATKWS
jgi:hypothetical protein